MKFVILDGFLVNFDGVALEIDGHEQIWYPATAPGQAAGRIGDADGVLVNRTAVTGEIMEACPNLRFIGTFGTGYNMVDLEAATRRGIVVCNAPDYSTGAVAQHTMALLLELAGKVSVFHGLVSGGGWAKGGGRTIVSVPTMELAGKTMGIFGAGSIGLAVGRMAAAFGMEVIAYRRTPPEQGDGVTYVDRDTLLARSDVLSVNAPLNGETRGYFTREVIGRMKNGAILLNTARGAILDEAAVAEALDSGKLAGFGADVLTQEPPEAGNPLVGHPRAVITPHVAWKPRETRERLMDIVSANILAFAAGEPRNVVNP